MSFLHNVRMVFAGKFQADVSTVNNDVRHFDNATFKPAYQEFHDKKKSLDLNGWWNPTGSNAFRLLDCRIVLVGYADGSTATSHDQDAAIGLRIGGSEGRTSAKIVDIDPQWQLASAPWGLDVSLIDSEQTAFFSGHYQPHAFRDLWFGRMNGASQDAAAAATFQSVLDSVTWSSDLKGSRSLTELMHTTTSGRLSIRLMTFGFSGGDPTAADFTIGTVTGVIGPYFPDEPASFILGRRFAPANGSTSGNGCSYFSGSVDRAATMLFVDLSNGLKLAGPDKGDALVDIGALQMGILKNPEVAEFTPATSDNFLPIGEIDYRSKAWLLNHSGIAALPLTKAHLDLIDDHPLALAAKTNLDSGSGLNGEFGQIAIRETAGGLFVEAEPIVHRIDAPGKSNATIYAARYGAPLPNAQVNISQLGPMPEQGGDGGGAPNPPKATIPIIGIPQDKFKFPSSIVTAANGTAKLEFSAEDPGTPRTYLDGQIYLIDFRLPSQGNQARSSFDYIVTHVRDACPILSEPTWDDVAPILTQYGNLYPIMSRQLVNLSNPHDIKRHAKLLHFAFDQPITSPNYMPVTRDLSQAKRETILKFLDRAIAGKEPALEAACARIPEQPMPAVRAYRPGSGGESDGKTIAARNFTRATRASDI